MIYIFAGFVLLTIELVMLSMLMSKKEVLADGPRSAFWWEQLVILYHLPSIVLVALVSREKSGPYWVVSVVTFVAYLALFVAVILLGVTYLHWNLPANMTSLQVP
jgi:hypothetical protein